MTFKHLKFAESSTMQAFEKLAKAKGLVKPEAVTKTAAKTLDLNPSENLLENILKLAQGLRVQGFSKHANDLENKFLVYKKAESLYETSKETGDDLVDQAHPKGSHKMDGQDHTVLTIVDQKKKIEEIVNKKPSGKLTTAENIIDAVKLVFAQSAKEKLSFNFLQKFLLPDLNSAIKNIQESEDNRSIDVLSSIKSTIGFISGLTEVNLPSEIDKVAASVNKIKEDLTAYSNKVQSDWTGDAFQNSKLALIQIDGAISTINKIKQALKSESLASKTPKFLQAVNTEIEKVRKMGLLLNTLSDEDDKAVGKQWIEYFNKSLTDLKDNPHLQNADISDRIVDKLTPTLDKLRKEISDFDSKL